ncbi:DNA damage-binding protein 1 [Porphyridium purpureum]|uniref:DNA damage-binding protein 1 n=1 Tax=Porphyridium purpureum TaxID=35688 RepID=A0A5J4Z1G9_PORPP|nr:DNA damage-binding protein 1 [Porphyridium purpureum]|eukprot:POR8916..scf295_1
MFYARCSAQSGAQGDDGSLTDVGGGTHRQAGSEREGRACTRPFREQAARPVHDTHSAVNAMYNYVVSAHKASAVTHTAYGRFLSPHESSLLICRGGSRIEVYRVDREGLVPAFELPVYGTVVSMVLFDPSDGMTDNATTASAALASASSSKKKIVQPAQRQIHLNDERQQELGQRKQQYLLILTSEQLHVAIIKWNDETQTCETMAFGIMKDRIGSLTERPYLVALDPRGRSYAVNLYDRLVKIIPGELRNEAYNIRVDACITSMQFLDGEHLLSSSQPARNPTLAMLYIDADDTCKASLSEILVQEKDASAPICLDLTFDMTASRMVAVPYPHEGFLVFCDGSITYVNRLNRQQPWKAQTKHLRVVRLTLSPPAIINAVGFVDKDGSRMLVGDNFGKMRMLVLESSGVEEDGSKIVRSLHLETLGTTSIASTITYCDRGFIFVGSTASDSQLLRLTPDKHPETGNYFEVMESFTNLAPIVDFCIVDREKQGQSTIVTCSGIGTGGSLRVVRNGISITEVSSAEAEGIKELFALRKAEADAKCSRLLVSFTTVSSVYELADDEMSELEVSGLDEASSTIYACNLGGGDFFVQVTESRVLLIYSTGAGLVDTWLPPSGTTISLASGNESQLLLATTGGGLYLLQVDPVSHAFLQVSSQLFEHDLSCLDVTPLDASKREASVAVVGLWTEVSVRVLALPSLELLHLEKLKGETIARSVQLAHMDGVNFVIVAIGDGYLIAYRLEFAASDGRVALLDQRKISLGSQPASLSLFRAGEGDSHHVFAACDRPTIIHTLQGSSKMLSSNANLRDVKRVCGFDTESYPQCLAIALENTLMIGRVDEIQRLHVRSVPLHEQPRRICHIESAHAFAVITSRIKPVHTGEHGEGLASTAATAADVPRNMDIDEDVSDAAEMAEYNYLTMFDDVTFERLTVFAFAASEIACSLAVVTFQDCTEPFLVVGTAYLLEDEDEPSRGRVLVFSTQAVRGGNSAGTGAGPSSADSDPAASSSQRRTHINSKGMDVDTLQASGSGALELLAAKEVKGAVYSLNAFSGKLLAGINAKVSLFKWVVTEGGSYTLAEMASHYGHSVALIIRSRGDFFIVGDLQKSITLLAYKPVPGRIEEIARDYDCNWMMAAEMIDDDTFLGAENSTNLFALHRSGDSATEEDRSRLDKVGRYHLGELVNCFAQGSLVRDLYDQETSVQSCVLFGTVSGTIGLIAGISAEAYKFLHSVQQAMNAVIREGIGALKHDDFRSFRTERMESRAINFLDGDLIERYLDLSPATMAEIAAKVGCPTQELVKRIEELQRIH